MSKPAALTEPPVPVGAEAAAELPQSKLAKTFAAFTYRDFRLLWFGAFTSSAGTWLQEAALSWLLFSLTNKERYLGYNQFLSTAPILVFTLIGGVIADRIDKRRILLTSQWIQLGCAVVLSAMAFSYKPGTDGMVFVWTALALAVVTGCAQAFGGPAYQSLVPMLVEKKDLPNAISLNSIQFQLARTVGPLIGTLPFAWMAGNQGMAGQMKAGGVSFAFNAFSFLAVIVSLSLLHVKTIPNTPTTGMRHAMSEGINFVWHQEALRSLTLLAFSCTFFGMQMTGFFAALAERVFQLGARGNATMLAVSGAGAVTGALVMASFGNLPNKGRRALMMQIAFGLTIIAFSFATNLWLAYALIFMCGVFMMCVFASIASLVQLIVDDAMRGRVMSIYMLAFRGGMPLGALLTGYLAEHFALMHILRVQGIAVVLLALAYLLSNSSVKKH